jgi:hypothetical protein
LFFDVVFEAKEKVIIRLASLDTREGQTTKGQSVKDEDERKMHLNDSCSQTDDKRVECGGEQKTPTFDTFVDVRKLSLNGERDTCAASEMRRKSESDMQRDWTTLTMATNRNLSKRAKRRVFGQCSQPGANVRHGSKRSGMPPLPSSPSARVEGEAQSQTRLFSLMTSNDRFLAQFRRSSRFAFLFTVNTTHTHF